MHAGQERYQGPRVTRKEAGIAGARRYFTGNPCAHGHTTERYVLSNGCTVCSNKNSKRWNKRNQESRTIYHRQWVGLPEPTRPAPELCECCGGAPGKRAMHLDHDHETGKFRGWLCSSCNRGIGLLGDSLERLQRATDYLKGTE